MAAELDQMIRSKNQAQVTIVMKLKIFLSAEFHLPHKYFLLDLLDTDHT